MLKFTALKIKSNFSQNNLFYSLFLSLGILFSANAQKQPLNHDVYDDWEGFGKKEISDDGVWSAFHKKPQEGDQQLYFQNNNEATPKKTVHRGEGVQIASGSGYAAFLIKPFYKDIKEEKIRKQEKGKKNNGEELAGDTLGIYSYGSNAIQKFPEVKSFKFPKKNGAYVAYIQEQEDESADTTDGKKPEKIKQLILRGLNDQEETSYLHVDQYVFSEDGSKLAFTIENPEDKKKKNGQEEKEKDSVQADTTKVEGVYLVDTETRKTQAIEDEKGIYKRLTFSEASDKIAFVGTQDDEDEDIKDYELFLYDIEEEELNRFDESIEGVPEDWVVSEHRNPSFSKDGEKLFLGTAPRKEPEDTTMVKADSARVDIWHYKDDYLQPEQLKRRKRDLKKSYLSVINLDKPDQLVQIQEENMNNARLVDEGNADFVFAMSDFGHRIETQWDVPSEQTYYIINTQTGEQTKIIENLQGRAQISPKGKHVVYYDAEVEHWYAYDIESEETRHLNKDLDVSFADEKHDMPAFPSAYPLAGWTKDDESVLINDRYDLWEFYLNEDKPAKNITRSFGRKKDMNFAYLKLDSEERSIDKEQPAILHAFDESDKQAGYYQVRFDKKRKPKKLLLEPMGGHRSLIKAKDEEVYSFVHHSFETPPTLVSTSDFKNLNALHQTNKQQEDYNWGTVELVDYKTLSRAPAKGMLYKPEDFDENKEYPLLLYFYERKSDDLHDYEPPAPTPSRLNISFFVSNGYLVFVPDIKYTDGYPGKSAEEYVDGGIDFLKQKDWVDGDRVGIQGQSWGGYQVAHLITRSDRYAAAWAGAPVANMTSAYGGIRWGTGKNRQFQYEKTQSRIGKTLWEDLDLYIENSPLFHFEEVTTPVAIMHNDNDGAVPWYQGIEMFTALRRLHKPTWLLNYNDDEHNLMKRRNRKDIQRRQQQFFDHYLKDKQAPVWMTEGVPATEKGKTWGFELTDEAP